MTNLKRCEIELGSKSEILTGQQKAVVLFLALGLSNKAIGTLMHRSPETVKSHVDALLGVFSADSRAGIVGQAFCHGVLRPPVNAVLVLGLGFLLGMGSSPQLADRHPLRNGPRSRYQAINLGALTA